MKRITINKIVIWIYALLMCLPLISVGFRSLYVIFNKNAIESYSGQVNTEYTPLNSLDNFIIGKKYMFNNNFGTYTDSSQKNTGAIFYTDAKILSTYNTNAQNTINNGNNFTFYYNTNGISIYVKYNTTDVGNWTVTNQYSLSFEFILENYNSNLLSNNYSMIRSIDETNESYLDNAFDYSLSEFIKDNNTGLINFVGLFTDMFLGNQNLANSLYLGFANFMMNYALFITCAYFVFEVLMWFINYVRRYMYSLESKGD